jgi:hypothetical protein
VDIFLKTVQLMVEFSHNNSSGYIAESQTYSIDLTHKSSGGYTDIQYC